MAKMDVIGKRFGRLLVLRRKGEGRPLRYQVICMCDCGKEWSGYLYSLTTGYTKSCGCLNVELAVARSKGTQHHIDLKGQRFGRLLVVDRRGVTKDRNAIWLCTCDCGEEKNVSAHALKNMNQKSCGCLQRETARLLMTKHGRYKERSYIHELSARRSALLRGATVEIVDPAVVYERDMGLCGICGLPVEGDDFHLDHRIPVVCGGQHSYKNCQTTHAICNLRKNKKPMNECAHLWAR